MPPPPVRGEGATPANDDDESETMVRGESQWATCLRCQMGGILSETRDQMMIRNKSSASLI
eukprot:50920-Pyramimonas_sp.AAC.1